MKEAMKKGRRNIESSRVGEPRFSTRKQHGGNEKERKGRGNRSIVKVVGPRLVGKTF